jgi:hypothetical protein
MVAELHRLCRTVVRYPPYTILPGCKLGQWVGERSMGGGVHRGMSFVVGRSSARGGGMIVLVWQQLHIDVDAASTDFSVSHLTSISSHPQPMHLRWESLRSLLLSFDRLYLLL